ncbi:NlpC/P60 family protein [Clostridium baratii]|uniref:C40 family peptidase n=1 Tax=Clostridium baratii TaxID=1561 RepID=UPI003BAE8C80
MSNGKIIKKIIFTIGLSNCFIFLLIFVFIAGIFGMVQEENKNQDTSTGVTLVGVPAEFIPHFNEASELTGIPNWVLCGISKQESNFNPKAEYQGAYGIMQIQKHDFDGSDIWKYYMDYGLGEVYKKAGYKFSDSEDMWKKYLDDPRAQIIAGAYETMYYANYVLFRKGIITTLNYNNVENMKLIKWDSDENDSEFRELLRRIFACYNGGQGYGMTVDLDKAQNNYPNMVYKYAMEFRKSGLQQGGNEAIEKAIEAGMKWVDKSPYVWGAGRNEEDVKAGRFDCSSFVHYCYASAGIQLGDRSSVTTWTLLEQGKVVDKKDMKRGDIIFFDTTGSNTHVGLYLGNGKFIHDSSSKGVTISELSNSYYSGTFNGNVRRVTE